MIIAIDFDGTLVTNEFPRVGEPLPGATETLKELLEKGHKLILLTMRDVEHYCDPETNMCKEYSLYLKNGKQPSCLEDAVGYCHKNGIILWGVNKNPQQWKWSDSRKVYADFYIDDQALGVPTFLADNNRFAVDWGKIRELLLEKGLL